LKRVSLLIILIIVIILSSSCDSPQTQTVPPVEITSSENLKPETTSTEQIATLKPERTEIISTNTHIIQPSATLLPAETQVVAQQTQSILPTTARPNNISEMRITFPIMSSEMAEYFNSIARPDDWPLITSSNFRLLPEITEGKPRVGFTSWAEAEKTLPILEGKIDMVVYNPEHWDATPRSEKENLLATIEKAALDAQKYGMEFMVAPDRRYAEQYIGEIAARTKYIGLQGQRIQNDPVEFESWIRKMITAAREANPEVKIIVQVGATRGTAEQMYTAINTVIGEIDGISIWTIRKTLPILKDFINMIRPEG